MRLKPQHSFVFITLTGMLLFLIYPAETADGVHAAMGLCFNILLPTLFPISVCTGCLMRLGAAELAGKQLGAWLGAVFGCSGVGFLPICLGFLGGYPLGALVLSELYQTGRLSRQEALHCSALCNHAGPGFLIGALGGKLLGSPARGLALISIQILSAWLVSLLMRQKTGLRARKLTGRPKLGSVPMSKALPEALETGALAMLRLTATVAFFGALTACLERMLPLAQLPQLAQAALVGALELSNGVSKLIGAGAEGAFILAAALTAWGGLCVHFQAFFALSAVGLPSRPYLVGMALQTIVSGSLAGLAVGFLNRPVQTGLLLALTLPAIVIFLRLFEKTHWKSGQPVL